MSGSVPDFMSYASRYFSQGSDVMSGSVPDAMGLATCVRNWPGPC